MPFDPRFLPIDRWSALTASIILPYGDVPRSATEETWKDWATAVKNLPALAPRRVPSPAGFGDDWRGWAFRLNEALYSLGL